MKFVCFYLQVLANKEQRLYCFSERQNAAAYAESRLALGSEEEEEGSEEEENSEEEEENSEKDSEKDNNSKSSNANSNSLQTQRTTRN